MSWYFSFRLDILGSKQDLEFCYHVGVDGSIQYAHESLVRKICITSKDKYLWLMLYNLERDWSKDEFYM